MRMKTRQMPQPPLTDYSAEVARAIFWLGERYLLASPINVARRSTVLRGLEDVRNDAINPADCEAVPG